MHRWSSRYAGTGSSDKPGCAIPALAQPTISNLQVSLLGRNVLIAADTGGEIALGTRAFGSFEPKMRVTSKREHLSGKLIPVSRTWSRFMGLREKDRQREGWGREGESEREPDQQWKGSS